ncbi:MAG TPA: NAD(P)-dependent oxidoreductase [Ramlibacter sp.]|nr:NAD(P)-dependent oxidoreductase [Ramlibacter sp.]
MATLGWIGIGDIGFPMMVRLREAGHEVLVWGRNAQRRVEAKAAGGTLVGSAAEVGARCEAVFLCVTDADAVEEIVFGPEGVASTSNARTWLVDHSTIHPGRTRDMAARLRAQQRGRWVDAPVSGGAVGARAGTLAVMAGGEREDVEAVTPWLRAYGGKITHVGGSGTGQACKSCNQAIANTTIMVWAELLAYARSFGLEIDKLVEATEGGFADSSVRRTLVPRIVSGEFPGHYASLIPKDLDIPCDMGRQLQTPMPVTSLVTSLYRHHQVLQDRSGPEPIGLLELFQRSSRNVKARF